MKKHDHFLRTPASGNSDIIVTQLSSEKTAEKIPGGGSNKT